MCCLKKQTPCCCKSTVVSVVMRLSSCPRTGEFAVHVVGTRVSTRTTNLMRFAKSMHDYVFACMSVCIIFYLDNMICVSFAGVLVFSPGTPDQSTSQKQEVHICLKVWRPPVAKCQIYVRRVWLAKMARGCRQYDGGQGDENCCATVRRRFPLVKPETPGFFAVD